MIRELIDASMKALLPKPEGYVVPEKRERSEKPRRHKKHKREKIVITLVNLNFIK